MEPLALKRYESGDELVARADEISIFRVLKDFFDIDLPSEGRSYKSWCPFGFEHPDGGITRTWRTYPGTNSSYCFEGHGYMTSVRLISIQRDWGSYKSAKYLLEIYGLMKPKNYRERFNQMVSDRAMRQDSIGPVSDLVEALHVALRGHPMYERHQFDVAFQQEFERGLAVLDGMLSVKATEVELRAWFAEVRGLLGKVLDDCQEELHPQ